MQVLEPNVLLVPLLMFSEDCNRLGYGGGFYDRSISNLRKVWPNLLTIGLGLEVMKYESGESELPQFQLLETDEPLDFVVTEK